MFVGIFVKFIDLSFNLAKRTDEFLSDGEGS